MSAADGMFRQPEGQHPLPLHGPHFDADPQATYEKLRATGPIAPVELAPGVYAQLTTTYEAAQHLLTNTPRLFVRDPKRWDALREGSIPPDSPVLMMIQDRPNALWTDGAVHERYRSAIADSLQKVDTLTLTRTVTQIADGLIDAFADRGTGDLVADFTALLPMQTMFGLCGCPADIGGRIVGALIKLFDTAQDAYAANAELERACLELVLRKRADPGSDVISWMIRHPAELSDEEMVQQIILVIGAGTEPLTNLIGNALKLLIADDRYAGTVTGGVRTISEALHAVLWDDPPMANYSPLYALRPMQYRGVRLEPGIPILVSFAAANTDPIFRTLAPEQRAGNHAHLAFSAGAHACPAKSLAVHIAQTAIERVLDRLPELTLACRPDELTRRPGTFHSGWTSLPVTFPPVTAPHSEEAAWTPQPDPQPAPSGSTPPAAISTPKPPTSVPRERPRWLNSLARWWRGQ